MSLILYFGMIVVIKTYTFSFLRALMVKFILTLYI